MSVSISVKVGRKTGEPMKQEEMDVIIKEHKKWLEKNGEGKRADLREANLDNTVFKNATLKNAVIIYAPYMEYTDLTGADFTGAVVTDCTFADGAANSAKGLNRHMLCPEEGGFFAWKKCREDRIVKLLVPENALRTGGFHDAIRASEVNVLDIIDPDGEHKGSAVSLRDESLIYSVGETVKIPENEFDGSLWHRGAGIYFFLTRGEAERFEYKKNDKGKNEDEE